MTLMRTLREGLAARMMGTPGTWAAAAVYTNWVQLGKVGRRALIIAGNGELDADLTVEVFEATDASGTDATELTGITNSQKFTNGTDEGRVGLVEVLDTDLTDGFDYIALKVTPGATDSFAAFVVISDLYDSPASNLPADGVAFNVGN
jgi:hypothetical protein